MVLWSRVYSSEERSPESVSLLESCESKFRVDRSSRPDLSRLPVTRFRRSRSTSCLLSAETLATEHARRPNKNNFKRRIKRHVDTIIHHSIGTRHERTLYRWVPRIGLVGSRKQRRIKVLEIQNKLRNQTAEYHRTGCRFLTTIGIGLSQSSWSPRMDRQGWLEHFCRNWTCRYLWRGRHRHVQFDEWKRH